MSTLAHAKSLAADLYHLNKRLLAHKLSEVAAARVAIAIERAAYGEMQAMIAADDHAQSYVPLTPAPR